MFMFPTGPLIKVVEEKFPVILMTNAFKLRHWKVKYEKKLFKVHQNLKALTIFCLQLKQFLKKIGAIWENLFLYSILVNNLKVDYYCLNEKRTVINWRFENSLKCPLTNITRWKKLAVVASSRYNITRLFLRRKHVSKNAAK